MTVQYVDPGDAVSDNFFAAICTEFDTARAGYVSSVVTLRTLALIVLIVGLSTVLFLPGSLIAKLSVIAIAATLTMVIMLRIARIESKSGRPVFQRIAKHPGGGWKWTIDMPVRDTSKSARTKSK